jgi:trimeric autotransporter adhesin
MKKLVLLITLITLAVFANAQVANDFRSRVTGNWNVAANWERFDGTTWATSAVIPGATANNGNVTIQDGHTITVTVAPTAAISSLTVGGGTSGVLNIGAFAITITGATNISAGGTLNVTGLAGVKTFTGDFTNNGTWTNSINSAITMSGNIVNNGTFTSGTGVYSLTGATKTINTTNSSAFSINSVTIPTGASYAVSSNFTSSNAFTIPTALIIGTTGTSSLTNNGFMSAGALTQTLATHTFVNNGIFTITGTVFTGAGVFTNATNATLNWTSTGLGTTTLTATAAGNTVNYNNTAAAQTVKATSYVNLTVDKTAQTATLGAATVVNGNLNIVSGNLAMSTFGITGNATGQFNLGANCTLTVGLSANTTNVSFPLGFVTANIDLDPTSTVIYAANAAQAISAAPSTYGNLSLTATVANTKTLGGAITVAGNLSIGTLNTFAIGTNSVTVNGNVSHISTGAITASTGKIILSGGSAVHTITGNGTYPNLELNDTQGASLAGSSGITVSTSLLLTDGAFSIGINTITINGTFAYTTGTFTGGSSSIITLGLTGGAVNFPTITNGLQNLNLSRTTAATHSLSAPLTLSGNLLISANNTFNLNGNIVTMSGTYTNSGTLTANAVGSGFRFTGGGALTFTVGTYTGTVINSLECSKNTGIAVTLGAAITVVNLNVSSGNLATSSFQITGNAGGNMTLGANTTLTLGLAGNATNISFPTNFVTANISLDPTSTVNYNANAAQVISVAPPAYGNLTLTATLAQTKTLAASITVAGTLNIGTLNSLSAATSVVTVNKDLIVGATAFIINSGSGGVYLTGGAATHNISGTGVVYALEVDDATYGAALTGNITLGNLGTGGLTLTNGIFAVGAFNLTLNGAAIAGTGTNLSTTTTSTLTFGPATNASAGLYIPSSVIDLSSLVVSIAGTNTLTLNSSINLNLAGTALTLSQGRIILGSNNLTIGSVSGLLSSAATVNAMVVADGTGQLRKNFNSGATAAFTFPVGDNTGTAEYSPFVITMSANSTPRIIGVNVTDGIHPQMNSNATQTNYISRYWSFTDSQVGVGTYSYSTSSFTYINTVSDVTGTIATTTNQINRYDNAATTWYALNMTGTAPTFTTSGTLTETTGKLGGNDFTIRNNPAQIYTWQPITGSADWQVASNWTPTRITPASNDVLQFINGGNPTATNVPTQTIGTLTINGNTDVTLTSAAATQTLTIAGLLGTTFTVDAGSALRLSTTATNSTIIAFSGTNVTNIAGTLELNTNTGLNNTINFTNLLAANNIITGTITNNGGVVTSTTATTTFGAGAAYNHARNGGAIPGATWNATSTINITGITNTNLTGGLTGTIGNLTWNNSAQTATGITNGALTIAGNLNVQAGTLLDNSLQITGNATGTLTVASGATLQLSSSATATAFPTNFIPANITLATGSTVLYASSGAQSIAGLNYHNLTLVNASTKTATGAITINGNLTITNSTFTDNGFQITGNATGTFTMSGSANSILILGNATTATTFPTNFVAGNITLNSPSVVRYNSNVNQTVSNVPTYSVLQLQSAGGTPTKTLAGNTLVTGSATPMVNIGAANTFNLGGFNLTLQNSGGTSPITNTGTISANTDGGSTIILNGTGHSFATGTILTTARPNLTIAVNAAATVTITQTTPQVALSNLTIGASNTLSLSAGAQLGIAGTYTNNGTLTANTSGTTITLNGSSPQTFTVGTYTGTSIGAGTLATSGGLAINNTAGVTLGSAVNVPVLTLTNGVLTTSGTNLLTVTGTAVACVSGGSASNYVNGPLVRSLPASLVSGSTYTFPVGKANFNTFDLINPTTTVATTVRVEAFDATAGGTDGIGFSSSPTPNRYWQASVPTGALTSGGIVRLLDASVTVDGNTVVGNSATLTGTYAPLGGTNPNAPSSGYITSTATAPTALGFFKMGSRGCLSGTYTIGATGADFTNITSAVSTLNGSQVCGNITFELQTNYVGSSGETFPITINAANYSGGPWNILVRPTAAVASNLTTSGTIASQIFNFNGIDRLTFDGRPGGTGSTIRWVIANASTSGQVIAFNNDATNNALNYLQVEGVNTTTPGTGAYTNAGLIAFGNTAPAIGNEFNVIDNCFIKDGATIPLNAIYSFGSPTANLGNDNNQITNNRLANVWAAATSTSFINLQTGNSAWTINGNSFNQTATRTGTGTSTHTMILISNTSGNGFTINNNYIGGSGALATGTWTQTGIADARFNGMTLSVGSTTASNVQGNTFGNIAWAGNGTATVNSAMFHAIYVTNGLINIGTTTGNIIGNATYPITITFNNTTISQAGTAYGIYNNSPNGQINIQNNTIGSITGAITTNTSFNFSAIVFGQGTGSAPSRIINGNTISNITIAGSSVSAGTSNLYGIAFSSGSSAAGEIRNNNIFSLTNNYSGNAVGSQVVGIQIPTTPNAFTITGNTIYSLSCAATHTSTTTSSAAIGISYTSSISSGHTISNNTIHTLSATAAAAAANVIGIYFSPALSGTGNSIDGNLIHSLALSTSSTTSTINGIYLNQGTATVSNNMIRLGINAAGSSLTTGYAINGINEILTLNNFYSNSVYIGGTGVASSTSPTYALLSAGTGTRAIQNNIFWNARSNAAGTAKHFAIRYVTATGLTSSFNDLLATGTGAVLGNIGGVDNTSLAALSSNSISADPMFINPTGNAASVDLHIQASPTATPIESVGVATPVLIDFDGQTRTSFTAEDIGADASNFTPVDLTAPTVTYTPFAGACNTVGTGTYNVGSVTITDASGVNTTAGTKPRIYYKKSTDAANTYNDNTSGTAGWKFVEANGTTSPFNFDINFALLSGGTGVTAGDVIQYFIVAQDQGTNVPPTPNVAINSGTFAATPSSVALTSAAFAIGGSINTFSILPCQGTITVGTSGTDNYTSLTNAGGIFAAINATTITGNLTVNITTDLTAETGAYALNQLTESGVGNYTATFQSSAAVARTISGSYNGAGASTNGLVRLNGADRITFNGGTGTQRFLIINNSGSGGNNAAFALLNGAQNNTINNCAIACGTFGATTANGVVFIGASVSSGAGGNSNNTITNNDIDNLTTFPLNGIYADGTSAVGSNTGNIISSNNITDFYIVGGGSCAGITLATANTAFTISNNNIYQTANRISASPVDYHFIRIGINTTTSSNGVGFTISGNKIGGTGRDGSGNITGAWSESNSGTAHRFYGILINQSATTGAATTIENNIISGFNITTSSAGNITGNSGGAWNGIAVVSGNVNIGSVGNGNIIGSTAANGAIALEKNGLSGPTNSAAIWVNGSTTNVNTVGNTIAGIDLSQTSSTDPYSFYAIYYQSNNALSKNITNNTIGTVTTTGLIRCLTGADNQNLVGIFSAVTNGATINISNNRIAGLNANGGSSSSGTGRTVGIEIGGGTSNYTILNNRIFNLTNQSFNNGALATPAVAGIRFFGGGTLPTTISGNTIYALTHTSTAQNVSITGIYFNGSTSTGNVVSNNNIHSFEFISSSNSASLFGIVSDGTSTTPVTFSNNVIRLGIRPNGTSVPNSTIITGIFDNSTAATNVYYNTVYIGGTSVSVQTGNSYAYRRTASSGADIIRNNIFANDRSGGSGSSLHLAFATNTLAGYTAANFDNNIFYSKNNTEFSIVATPANLTAAATTALRLQAMRAQIPLGNNLRSGIATLAQINFINATGDSSAVDLQLNVDNCAVGAGIAISTINTDGFGNSRNTTGAVAIGAHEGAFNAMLADNDIYTPNFSFTNIPVQGACGGSTNIVVDVTITDIGTAVPTSGSVPVIWLRRSAPSATTWAPTSGVLQSGNGNSGVWRFTVPQTLAAGETYQYYFVADDQATNQALSPAGVNRWYSSFDATTPVVTLTTQTTQPATVNIFATNIATPLSGTVLVGSGQTYTTFGGVGGLFEAIQNNGLSGDLTALVTSNITDNNITSLSQWQEYCGSGYKLYIKPQTTGTKVISVTAANGFGFGFIKIQGADRVIIDGSFGGSGNFLTFRNLYASNANIAGCIYMDGICENDTIRNITIEGQGHHLQGGNLIINTSSGSSVYVDNCIIKGVASNAVPNNLVYSATSGSGMYTITNCNLYDFSNFGSSSAGQLATALLVDGLLSPSATWTITNNSIYNTFIDGTSSQKAIRFAPGTGSNGNIISGNYIGGTAPLCAGTAMTNNTLSDFIMMEVSVGSDVNNPTVISNNTIQNILAQSGDAGGVTSLDILGSSRVNITGNTIGHATLVNSIQSNGGGLISGLNTGWCYGITSSSSSTITISNNTIAGLASVGSFRSFVNCIEITGTGAATITDNTIANSYIGANTSGNNCYGLAFTGTGNTNHIVSNNTFTKLGSSNATVNGNYATAILFNGNNQGAIIERNIITDLFHIGNGGESNGIHIVGSNANYIIRNNQINMLNRSWLATYTTRKIFNGIHDWATSGTVKIYNNTIYVQGSQTGTSGFDYSSACYYRLPNGSGLVTGANVDIKNNILVNSRTGNPTANSLHYVIDNTNTSNPSTGWSSNYNLMSNVTSANFAFWGSANRTFAQWQTVSGGDANSQAPSVLTSGANNTTNGTLNPVDIFVSTTTPDLHINLTTTAPYPPYQYVDNLGISLSEVNTDFDSEARSLTTPDIGADEFAACSITANTITAAQTICSGTAPSTLGGSVTTVPGSPTFQWESSIISGSAGFSPIGGATSQTYSPGTLTQTTWFRRVVYASSCSNNSTAIQITVSPIPTANAGADQTICHSGGTITGASVTNNNGFSWSTSGTGTFSPNNTTLAATYIPSAGDIGLGTVTLTLTATNSGCADATDSKDVTIITANNWIGSTSTDWFTASNWCLNGAIPTATTNVTIPSSLITDFDPLINGAGAVCGSIFVNTNGIIGIAGSNNLDVHGDWNNSGTFDYNSSTVTFKGSTNTNIGGASTPHTFYNLTVNKGTSAASVTSTDNINVINQTTITQGVFKIDATTVVDLGGVNTVISSNGTLHVNGGDVTATGITSAGVVKPETGTLDVTNGIVFTGGAFNQSTAAVTLSKGGANSNTAAVFTADGNTAINITGGSVIFQLANAGTAGDVSIASGAGTKTITGGTFQFGNAATTSGQVFKVDNNAVDFNNFTVDNSNATTPTVRLTSNAAINSLGVLTVNSTLDLNQRLFLINNNSSGAVTRTSPGYIMSESQNGSSRIVWNLGGTTGTNYTFPLGNAAGVYMPLTMKLNSGDIGFAGISSYKSAGATSGNWPLGSEAVTNVANPGQAVQRFWHLESSASPTTYNVDVTFSFDNVEDPTLGLSSVVKMQRYNKPTNSWDFALPGQVFANTTTRTVMVPGITKFSWWGGGNDASNNNPLPIELTTFKASCDGNEVRVNWTTATEVNNDYFTVQRSTDLVTFDNIAVVEGAGNSNTARNYDAVDYSPVDGIAYYRLVQTDYNGQTETFNPVAVTCSNKPIDAVTVYPNPAQNELHVNINLSGDDQGTLVVYNHLGQQTFARAINAGKGFNNYTLDVSGFAAGQYFVSINLGSRVLPVQKLVITK